VFLVLTRTKKRRKIISGIIANTNPIYCIGQWMLYEGEGKEAKEGDWAGCTRLET
jgi:hypothetical protein